MVVEELFDIVDSIADLTVDDVRRHLSNRCKEFQLMHRSGLILNRAVSQLPVLMALFSESSGGGGDGGENIIGANDSSLAGDIGRKGSNTGENIGERWERSANRKDTKDDMNEEDCLMNQTNNHRNRKIEEEEIELKRNYYNGADQKENNKETEQVDKKVKVVQKIEEDAVKAVAEASKVVAGSQTVLQRLDQAIESLISTIPFFSTGIIHGSVSGDVATKTVMEAARAVAGEKILF